jgi:hypothetical protein
MEEVGAETEALWTSMEVEVEEEEVDEDEDLGMVDGIADEDVSSVVKDILRNLSDDDEDDDCDEEQVDVDGGGRQQVKDEGGKRPARGTARKLEPWFSVEVRKGGPGEDSELVLTRLRKSWSEFVRLQQLLMLADDVGDISHLPKLPPAPLDVAGEKFAAQALCAYMNSLLAAPQILSSSLLSGFLDEKSARAEGGDALPPSGGTAVTAIDFILQPFDEHQVFIPRRSEYSVEMAVLRGETVAWRFTVAADFDVEFSVEFCSRETDGTGDFKATGEVEGDSERGRLQERMQTCTISPQKVRRRRRSEPSSSPSPPLGGEFVGRPTRCSILQGSYTCRGDGRCILRWGNAYSRLRGKRLSIVVKAVDAQVMQAAVEAADAAAHKSADPGCQDFISSEMSSSSLISVAPLSLDEEVSVIQSKGAGSPALLLPPPPLPSRRFSIPSIPGGSYLYQAAMSAFYYQNAQQQDEQLSSSLSSLMRSYEGLEDELAVVDAKKARAEAQTKVLLVKLQRRETDLARSAARRAQLEALLQEQRNAAEQREEERDATMVSLGALELRVEELEAALRASKREKDLLQAERNVWQVARTGIQSELSKVVNSFELERQGHDETKRLFAKAQETLHRLEVENHKMARQIAEQGDKRLVDKAREDARLATEEAEDAKAALAEQEAHYTQLKTEKKLLVHELRQQKKKFDEQLASLTCEVEEARMSRTYAESRLAKLEAEQGSYTSMQAETEIRLQRLKAEKKLLVAELRRREGKEDSGRAQSEVQAQAQPEEEEDAAKSEADSLALIKSLSRQLVHLREKRLELNEQQSDERQRQDVERAIQQLQARIKRLMAKRQLQDQTKIPSAS